MGLLCHLKLQQEEKSKIDFNLEQNNEIQLQQAKKKRSGFEISEIDVYIYINRLRKIQSICVHVGMKHPQL